MQWLAWLFGRARTADESEAVHAHADAAAASPNVEELSVQLRDARGKARAARQRGRVMQRDGRMSDALKAFKAAGEHQERADRIERERSLIRRAG